MKNLSFNSSLSGLFNHTLNNILVLINLLLGIFYIVMVYTNTIVFNNTIINDSLFTNYFFYTFFLINLALILVHIYYGFENIILDYVHNVKVRTIFLFFVLLTFLIAVLYFL